MPLELLISLTTSFLRRFPETLECPMANRDLVMIISLHRTSSPSTPCLPELQLASVKDLIHHHRIKVTTITVIPLSCPFRLFLKYVYLKTIGCKMNKIKCYFTDCRVIDICFVIDSSGSIRDNNPPDGSYDNCDLLLGFISNVIFISFNIKCIGKIHMICNITKLCVV